MFKFFLIALFILKGNCVFAQNKIATYGSQFWYWTEFTFYDDYTYKHTTLKWENINGEQIKKSKITKGKYRTSKDTILILTKIQNTYNHGNISRKFLMINDSSLVDLELLFDYTKLSSFDKLKQNLDKAQSEKAKNEILSPYWSKIHPLKFPYAPLKNELQKKIVIAIFKDFFQRKEISTFFKEDSTILVRFFYKTEIEKLNISTPKKLLKFIRSIDTKSTAPKRVEFVKFLILDDNKTVYFILELYGKRYLGKFGEYAVKYKKLKSSWKLKSIKRIKQ